MILFFLLLFIPAIEVFLFIKVNELIGTPSVFALIFLTAFLGAYLLRTQGKNILSKLKEEMQKGPLSTTPIEHGFFLILSGILLMTPGFFTDAIGFLLCHSGFRDFFLRFIRLWVFEKIRKGDFHVHKVHFGEEFSPYEDYEAPREKAKENSGTSESVIINIDSYRKNKED